MMTRVEIYDQYYMDIYNSVTLSKFRKILSTDFPIIFPKNSRLGKCSICCHHIRILNEAFLNKDDSIANYKGDYHNHIHDIRSLKEKYYEVIESSQARPQSELSFIIDFSEALKLPWYSHCPKYQVMGRKLLSIEWGGIYDNSKNFFVYFFILKYF